MHILGTVASSYLQETNSYFSIQTISITNSSTSSVTFSNIPQTYSHLQLRCLIMSQSDEQYYIMTFNNTGTSGSAYVDQGIGGVTNSSIDAWSYGNSGAMAILGRGGGTNPTYPGYSIIDIMDYMMTNKYKVARGINTIIRNDSSNPKAELYFRSGMWMSTNAITSITIQNANNGFFVNGNKLMLFGIKGA